MDYYEWSCVDKLNRFESQLDVIDLSEFIRQSTKSALTEVRKEIGRLRKELKKAARLDDEKFLWPIGVIINQKIFGLTNSLGVLRRSTNLRNCVEAYYGLEKIVEDILGKTGVLIISSEWDASPFYIPEPPDALKSFVFIGMPAFISRNALFLPLTAHEIGHAVWRSDKIDGPLSTTAEYGLSEAIINRSEEFGRDFGLDIDRPDLFRKEEIVSDLLNLISSQCQETFCDILGCQMFGRSFAYAFDFHLSPGTKKRDPEYPSFAERAQYIKSKTVGENTQIKNPHILNAKKILSSSVSGVGPYIKWSDEITAALRPAIENKVSSSILKISPPNPAHQNSDDIAKSFRNYTPPEEPASIADILNAAWDVLLEKLSLSSSVIQKNQVMADVNNLCIKALEVFEYNSKFRT